MSRRILVVAPFAPRFNAHHGGSRAIAHVLHRLATQREIGLVYLREAGEGPVDEAISARLAFVEEVESVATGDRTFGPLRSRARDARDLARGRPRWVRELSAPGLDQRLHEVVTSWRPALVQVEYMVTMKFAMELGMTPIVVVEHDPAVAYTRERRDRRRGLGKLAAHAEVLAWRRFTQAALERASAVVVFTARDARVIRGLNRRIRIERIPLGVDVAHDVQLGASEGAPTLLFVGSFIHYPNVEAATRLALRIFPALATAHPELRLTLVGHRPTPEIRALARDRISVEGDVPDVNPYLRRATVFAAPISTGGGMRVKILEALAAGKPVVASPRALDGIAVEDGRHVAVAQTDDDFVRRISALLSNERARRVLGDSARAWVGTYASWKEAARRFDELHTTILGSEAPRGPA